MGAEDGDLLTVEVCSLSHHFLTTNVATIATRLTQASQRV